MLGTLLTLSAALAVPQDRTPVRSIPTQVETLGQSETPNPEPETFPVDLVFVIKLLGLPEDPSAEVTLEVGIGPKVTPRACLDEPALGRVTTGTGRATLRVDAPVEWRDNPAAHVWARVVTSGFQRATWSRPLSKAQEAPMSLPIRRGGTVYGRLTHASGAPVPSARIWLLRPNDERYGWARTDENGGFAVHFYKNSIYRLHARSGIPGPHCGTASVANLDLDAQAIPQHIELELTPHTTTAGRAVDPSGRPVAGARIVALPAGNTQFPSARACGRKERGAGFYGGLGRVDCEGGFELGALVPGRYDFYGDFEPRRARSGLQTQEPTEDGYGVELTVDDSSYFFLSSTLLATHTIEDPSIPIELVFPAHRTEVRVAAPDGSTPELYELDEDGDIEQAFLRVLDTDLHDYMDASLRPTPVGDTLVFPLRPERNYVAVWNDQVHAFVEESFSTDSAEPWLTRIDMHLETARAARVVTRVLDPRGNELSHQVTVRAAESMRALDPSWTRQPGGQYATELSPGRFVFEADAEPHFECLIPSPLPRAPFAPVASFIDLQPGEELVFDLQLGPAGHLDFESTSAAGAIAAARDDLCLDEQGLHDCDREEVRQICGGGFAYLTSADHQVLGPLIFDGPLQWTMGWIAPGWKARCTTPIPPGAWTLEVKDGDRVLFRDDLTVRAGETTVVKW